MPNLLHATSSEPCRHWSCPSHTLVSGKQPYSFVHRNSPGLQTTRQQMQKYQLHTHKVQTYKEYLNVVLFWCPKIGFQDTFFF